MKGITMKKRGRLKAGGHSPENTLTRGGPLWRSPWLLATLMVMVAAALLAFAFPTTDPSPSDGPDDPGNDTPGRVYHDVGIPYNDLGTEAQWYTYESGTSQVRFFGVLEENGKIHVGLDACDVCYSRKLGFHQDGDVMQCNSCGKAYEVKGIGSENLPGTCWPAFVPYEVSDGHVLIDSGYLDTKGYMFE